MARQFLRLEQRQREREKVEKRTPYCDAPTETKTLRDRHLVSLTVATVDSSSTEVRLSAVRTSYENGSVTGSGLIENKYLN